LAVAPLVGALEFWLLGAIVIVLGDCTTSLRALAEGLSVKGQVE
jgi:hypothetical protein